PRIVARLASGLVADIKPADLTLRRAVLTRKLADMPGVTVPDDVLDLMAARITTSIREIEGALNRLVAYAELTGEAIDLAFATTTLGD
ncbi:DnaA/Hda family protein, partial [Acinetobacter baumannii]